MTGRVFGERDREAEGKVDRFEIPEVFVAPRTDTRRREIAIDDPVAFNVPARRIPRTDHL